MRTGSWREGWLIGLVIGVAPVVAFAQTTPPATAPPAAVAPAPIAVLLRDPAALANWLATHSRDAGAAAARVAQAKALVGTAGLRPNLQVDVGLGGLPLGETNPPGIGVGNSLNYGVSVSQQFEIGKRSLRVAAADLRLASQRHALTDTLGGSLADARDAIGRVLYLESRQTALQEGLDTARQILELQRTRYERGDLSGIDLDRLQLDTQVLEADLAQSRADYADSLAACASVLFAPCDPGGADLGVLADAGPPPEALAASDPGVQLADRPDIQALQTLVKATEQDEALAHKRRVPDPILNAGYLRDHFIVSGNNPRTFGLSVTLPLATSDHGQYDAARAQAERAELQATSAAVLARAQNDVVALRQRHATLSATLVSLRADALARADAILQSTSDAVTQGELSTTDLLLARRARTEVALKAMDLEFQIFLTGNQLRQVLGLDVPLLRSVQDATWPSK